jgi:phosphatidylglycerol:prolipoprotein diacylglycerol transferase
MIEISINPIAFLTVRWYGIMVALGILALVLWVAWQVKRGARVSYDTVFMAALVGIPSGVVISRLLHVLDLWDYYSQNPGQIIGGSGLTIYGAILGAALGIWIYSKFGKFKFGYLADLITPGLILAQMIGRVGCTINGCCYGTACDLPWAVVYTHPESLGPIGIPVHPTQPYEIIFLALVFIFMLILKDRLKPDGSLFIAYIGLYGLWRLGIDFIREGTPFLFGLHQAQVIGIITLVISITLLAWKTRWVRAEEKIKTTEDTVPEKESIQPADITEVKSSQETE